VAEPDPAGPLRGGGEEDLGRGRVGVFLEEVVLDLPRMVDAETVGQLHLRQCVLEQLLLTASRPRTRELMLVEDAEFHAHSFRAAATMAAAPPS